MTRHMRYRRLDITARKTSKIEFLKRQVDDAKTMVAKAQAKYNSFVTKANTFAELYTEAESNKQTAESYWDLFLKVNADLHSINETVEEANLVAVDAFHDVKLLILEWESVTSSTIKAAESIMLAADYINKRKASNPLISNDLVNDAAAAAKAAQTTVKAVVNAFTDALSALSSSAQANNSTELTSVYLNIAISAVLDKTMIPLLNTSTFDNLKISKSEKKKLRALVAEHRPLEKSLKTSLSDAKTKAAQALTASESANKEMNRAKEQLSQAEASLATWEAALTAAETAVAG